MDNQPTNQEILEAINDFASHVEGEFSGVKSEISEIKSFMVTKDKLRVEFAKLETRMVSKGFFLDTLNEKFADFRGELVTLLRKGDNKLGALAGKLLKHKVLPTKAVQEILAMEPFTQ